LTDGGEVILKQTTSALTKTSKSPSSSEPASEESGSGYTLDLEQELRSVRSTAAFKTYSEQAGGNLRLDDVWEVVGGYAYTPEDHIKRRLRVLRGMAQDAQDAQLVEFMKALDATLKRSSGRKHG
jgi:hypothetical protein